MLRRPPRSTLDRSSAASDVYKRQRRANILWQFLTEAIILSSIGGLIGLALGAAGTYIISLFSDTLNATVAWNSVALAILFSAAVGLFFGIYPATRAAALNPIDALRYE